MTCIIAILTLGIGGAIYAKRRRRQARLAYLAEQGEIEGYDTKNMSHCERKQARRAMRAERRMHRGGCCGFRKQPAAIAPVAVTAEDDPERGAGVDEAVYTPRTEEFVHVDDVYKNMDPPAYDAAEEKEYNDEKSGAVV